MGSTNMSVLGWGIKKGVNHLLLTVHQPCVWHWESCWGRQCAFVTEHKIRLPYDPMCVWRRGGSGVVHVCANPVRVNYVWTDQQVANTWLETPPGSTEHMTIPLQPCATAPGCTDPQRCTPDEGFVAQAK